MSRYFPGTGLGVNVQVQPSFFTMSDFLSAEMLNSFDPDSGMPNITGDGTTSASGRSSTLPGTALRLTTASKLLAERAEAGKLKIVSAIYDLKTGVVTYLG